jgi:hypothetical protein
VLDAELVAVDREKDNELKSFQELSTRARGTVSSHEVLLSSCLHDMLSPHQHIVSACLSSHTLCRLMSCLAS